MANITKDSKIGSELVKCMWKYIEAWTMDWILGSRVKNIKIRIRIIFRNVTVRILLRKNIISITVSSWYANDSAAIQCQLQYALNIKITLRQQVSITVSFSEGLWKVKNALESNLALLRSLMYPERRGGHLFASTAVDQKCPDECRRKCGYCTHCVHLLYSFYWVTVVCGFSPLPFIDLQKMFKEAPCKVNIDIVSIISLGF